MEKQDKQNTGSFLSWQIVNLFSLHTHTYSSYNGNVSLGQTFLYPQLAEPWVLPHSDDRQVPEQPKVKMRKDPNPVP